MYINPIGYALHQVLLPPEVSDIIREGLQLGLQQRAEEEWRKQIWQRVLEASTRVIVKQDFHPTILAFLILYYVIHLEATLLPLLYVTISLLFGLDSHLG